MRIIKIGHNKTISTGVLVLMIALLSLFIPTRGTVAGLSSANLLMLCCIGGTIIYHKKPKGIPAFYWIYLLIMMVCMLYHFSDRYPIIHLIEITQIIGLVYLAVTVIRNEKDFASILGYIIVLFGIYAAFGILESLLQFNIFDTISGTQVVYEYANGLRFGLARSRGACGTSINNGMMLVMALCLTAYKIINAKKKTKKYSFIYILILINCFCTLSRAIWLEVCISQLLILMILRPAKQFKIIIKILGVALCAIVLCLIIQPQILLNISNIIGSMFDSIIGTITGDHSSEVGDEGDRLLLWGWVWNSVQPSVTWGMGYANNFSYLTPDGYIKKSIEVMWLYRLYQTGFVGLIGYIFLQISCLVYFRIKWTANKRQNAFDFNCMMFILCMAYFITQFSCAASEDLRFFYFLLGLAFSYNKIKYVEA